MSRLVSSPLRGQRGFSLIELMISLVIGLVVIGAVLAAYLGSGLSSRNSQALSQISEDANVALSVLRTYLSMVGYSKPIAVIGGGEFTLRYPGVSLNGCDTDFEDMSQDIGLLTCPAAVPGASGSVAIAYDVDEFNGVLDSDGVPLDCIGNSLTQQGAVPNLYYLSTSRFYLDLPSGASAKALYCRGTSATPAALVENVEDLQITYGVAAPVVTGENRRVGYYAKAGDLIAAGGNFANVMAVKICVLVASAQEVMDVPTPYQPCGPFEEKITPTDKRMYRAFTSTMVLQNRLGALQAVATP